MCDKNSFEMATLDDKQLMCLLTTLLNNEIQVIQVLGSCNTALLLLIDEYQKSQTLLHQVVMERNRSLRRYIRRRERFLMRRPRITWVSPGRTDLWWENLSNDRMPDR